MDSDSRIQGSVESSNIEIIEIHHAPEEIGKIDSLYELMLMFHLKRILKYQIKKQNTK